MFLDGKLTFNTSIGTAQAITTTADSSIIDVTGAGVGNAPAMINGFPATNTAIGSDYGAGDGIAIPHVYISITAVGSSANTLTVALKAAPDSGTYTEGAYTTLWTTRAIAENTLAVGDILDIQVPPIQYTIGEKLPRFYKLTYTASAAVTISVLAYLALNPQQSLLNGQYNNNYIVV